MTTLFNQLEYCFLNFFSVKVLELAHSAHNTNTHTHTHTHTHTRIQAYVVYEVNVTF